MYVVIFSRAMSSGSVEHNSVFMSVPCGTSVSGIVSEEKCCLNMDDYDDGSDGESD